MAKAKKMGRPPKGDEAMLNPVTVRLPPALLERFEELVAARQDGASKGQVLREVILAGIEELARKAGKKK